MFLVFQNFLRTLYQHPFRTVACLREFYYIDDCVKTCSCYDQLHRLITSLVKVEDTNNSLKRPPLTCGKTYWKCTENLPISINQKFNEEALRKSKSNEYEEEYGLFLYNATWILDNYISKRTSQMFVLLVNVQEWQLHCTGMVAKFLFISKCPGIGAALYMNGIISILFFNHTTFQNRNLEWTKFGRLSRIHVTLYRIRLYSSSYSLLVIVVRVLSVQLICSGEYKQLRQRRLSVLILGWGRYSGLVRPKVSKYPREKSQGMGWYSGLVRPELFKSSIKRNSHFEGRSTL